MTELSRQRYHLLSFLFGDESRPFIIADITFLAEFVQLLDCDGACLNGESQRLQNKIMLSFFPGAVAGRRKRRLGSLNSRIVGNT